MGLTIAESQAVLDARFPTTGATDWIGYSVDGANEWANLARTGIGGTGWAAATAADPSIKANANSLTSAAVATAAGTITHFAVFTASTAGTRRTDWQALDTPRLVQVADTVTWGVGALKVTET